MPKYGGIFEREPEEVLENLARREGKTRELEAVEAELALYDSRFWESYSARLKEMKDRYAEEALTGPEEGVTLARERYKLVRNLLQVPEELRQARAQITAALAALQEEK